MTFNYNFYKEQTGRWYIDIPSYPGLKDDLEMVSGADTMLDILAQGQDNINLSFSDKSLTKDNIVLIKLYDTTEIGGALYKISQISNIEYDFEIWLCAVTEWVFGYLPNIIYVI